MNDFDEQFRGLVADVGDDAEAAADAFHGLYEGPVIVDVPYEGLQEVPRPYRELAAAHQAWGIISSDGFENYLEYMDGRFDSEVKAGLERTGHGDCFAAISEARGILESGRELTEQEDDRLWKIFYDPIKEFHEIVGAHLLRHIQSA